MSGSGCRPVTFLPALSCGLQLLMPHFLGVTPSCCAARNLYGVLRTQKLKSPLLSTQSCQRLFFVKPGVARNITQSIVPSRFIQQVLPSRFVQQVLPSRFIQQVLPSRFIQQVLSSRFIQPVSPTLLIHSGLCVLNWEPYCCL